MRVGRLPVLFRLAPRRFCRRWLAFLYAPSPFLYMYLACRSPKLTVYRAHPSPSACLFRLSDARVLGGVTVLSPAGGPF